MSTCAVFSCIQVQTRSKSLELQRSFSTVFKTKHVRSFLVGVMKKMEYGRALWSFPVFSFGEKSKH